MKIFSMMITDGEPSGQPLSGQIAINVTSFRQRHASCAHHMYHRENLRELIAKHFDKQTLKSFDTLRPYAYKSDLGRMCLIYVFGGIYADLSFQFEGSVQFDGKRMSVFRDFMSSTIYDTSNGLFAAPPHHKAVAKAIELINGNVQQQYYGPTSLCPTGPTLFGKAIGLTCGPEDLNVGESVWRPHEEDPALPVHCISFRGQIIARKRKSGGGDVTQLGIHNGNNYHEIWCSRNVYGEAE